jgi:hypothetical protein
VTAHNGIDYQRCALTIELARSKVNKVIVLDGNANTGLSLALALVEFTFAILPQVNSEDLLLSFGVLNNEFKNTIDLNA